MLGKTLAGRYRIVRHLAGGGFGRTYLAEDLHLPGKPPCIIKHLKPISSMQEVLDMARDLFEREAKALYRLGKHDQIPSLYAHFEEDEEFFLAQEYIHGFNLNQEIRRGKKLSEAYVLSLLGEILPVLEFVHSQQVIHRDIKPSNIMRRQADNRLVLIDFGAVKEVSRANLHETALTQSTLALGSPGYMPNEQYAGRAQYASDIYALGVTCIQALTGVPPRDLPEHPDTHELQWQHLVEVSAPVAELLERMVKVDFRDRYRTVPELIQDFLKLPLLPPPPKVPPRPPQPKPELVLPPPAPSETLPLTQVAEQIEQLPDQLRVKKLMCLACTGILENDPRRLEQMVVQELLLSLYEICPSPEQLKATLLHAVHTIAPAKQAQYQIIASNLYSEMLPIYGVSSAQAQAISALEHDLQHQRIKKLLIYACRQTWENDPQKLQKVSVADLLQELRQLAPSFPKLKLLLEERVQGTSKPSEYQGIAALILEKLALSYDPITPPPETEEDSENNLTANPKPDLFDIRLELMRYCNPLRLKILLFTATGDVQPQSMDWTDLKSRDLDSLLRTLLSAARDLQNLEQRLQGALTHLQPSNLYHQISLQVLRLLKPLYV